MNVLQLCRRAAVLGLAAGLAAGSAALAGPRMTIPISSFSFGYVPQNATVSHGFWLHSEGDDSLRIIKVNPG